MTIEILLPHNFGINTVAIIVWGIVCIPFMFFYKSTDTDRNEKILAVTIIVAMSLWTVFIMLAINGILIIREV